VLTDRDIARISDRIVAHCAPLAVGVFGSYAIGTPRADSDLDLFVIKDSVERPAMRRRAVRMLLHEIIHPLDIHVFTPAEFEETVYEYQSFTWVVARQARLYYWSDEAARRLPGLLAAIQQDPQATTSTPSAPDPPRLILRAAADRFRS